MKIDAIKHNIVFRSGYPTFSSAGHLSYAPDPIHDHLCLPYRPVPKSGLLAKEEPNKLDYYA